MAVRRFSTLGLLAVATLIASGVYAVFQQVGSVPALFGTVYGRWLLLKLALLAALLAIAYVNRTRLRPQLERVSVDGGEHNVRFNQVLARLGRFVLVEVLLVAAILGVVAVLGLATPARHATVTWPLPFRFSWPTAQLTPWEWTRLAIGGLLVAAGLITMLGAAILHGRGLGRWPSQMIVGALVAVGIGLAVTLPPLAIDAYPTTYVSPSVAYTAASIARGSVVYRERCASCHGPGGAGDGPAAAAGMKPANLLGPRTNGHTAGDIFWWLTRGVSGSPGHGFADHLSPAQRWDVVNCLRALAAAEAGRDLGLRASDRPMIVAPDVGYTTGVGAERALREYRRTVVLLIFFRVPESFERLSRLGRRHFDFRLTGAEIVGVPVNDARTVYRALGSRPVLFPLVVEGSEAATAAYGLFDPGRRLDRDGQTDGDRLRHMELLIDRMGYLRARWIPSGSPDAPGEWNDVDALLREIARLAEEPALAPAPAEHTH
jgi:putative copper resistance protein D